MTWILGLALLLVPTALGYVLSLRRLARVTEEGERLDAFREDFILWSNGQAKDMAAYQSLVKRSAAVQGLTNAAGERFDYREPHVGVHTNYQIILNFLPQIYRDFHNGMFEINGIFRENLSSKIMSVDESLTRVLGRYEQIVNEKASALRNPISQYAVGIRAILGLPVSILRSLGMPALGIRIPSPLVAFWNALVSFLTLLAAAVTILGGWDEGLRLLKMMGITLPIPA